LKVIKAIIIILLRPLNVVLQTVMQPHVFKGGQRVVSEASAKIVPSAADQKDSDP